ncbi:uncharacterized protein LOC127786516 isoform X2 [Diospyros lotus]|uniref:uncharacterized protein LOC127786516 isoform X2 n=1 Tax=Diospyros lotus TaxID=55363 RepID=UPI00224CAEEF|nr:uncharacterized protein LOC127786516 isoform X2 [Diospyros lotus]
MEDDEEVEILEPYGLHFSDLMLLSSDEASSPPSSDQEEIRRLESIARSVMENLGPNGPGLITIAGVPNATRLRRSLLPLARRLALIDADRRKRVLKLKYMQGTKSATIDASPESGYSLSEQQNYPAVDKSIDFQGSEFEDLGNSFKDLGICMMKLGLCLARICDRHLGSQELEQSLLASCTAKGRLIHYHSTTDNLVLKEAAKSKQSTKRKAGQQPIKNEQLYTNGSDARSCGNGSNLWQQWHYDYGIFTVLTSPLFSFPCHNEKTCANRCFCSSCQQEYSTPSGHTYLKIFDPTKNMVQMVKASPESFIVQVGEAADIISKGKLRANLHSVCRPAKVEDLSRETFVVFLQPAWTKILSLSDYSIERFQANSQCSTIQNGDTCIGEHDHDRLGQELHKIVPPLSLRLKDGMTFAEFSKETTKQYYGGNGLQSKR